MAIPALMLLFVVLVIGTALLLRPTDPRQRGAFIPLLVSAGSVVLGLGAGSRLVVPGLALATATFIGFLALPHWFFLGMAGCGGATLIGSGLWLRRVRFGDGLHSQRDIHQALRLMATLQALPAGEPIEFTRLRAPLAAADGNLGAHFSTLEIAGYVRVDKDSAGHRPRTRIGITPAGRTAYDAYVLFPRTLLGAPPTG